MRFKWILPAILIWILIPTLVFAKSESTNVPVGLKLALIGSIKDEILNVDELAIELIKILKIQYPGVLKNRYEVDETKGDTEILMDIAQNRKCISKGNELDYSKAAGLLIDEFRSGVLGRLSLEMPEES